MLDVKIEKDVDGIYDIVVDEERKDFASTSGLNTSILCSLLCYQRADDTEANKNFQNEGFAGDVDNEIPFGSKIWLLRQAKRNTSNANRGRDFISQSLNFLVSDGYAEEVETSATLKASDSSIEILSEIKTSGGDNVTQNIQIWKDTIGIE